MAGKENSGKQYNQKLKPYAVMQYLLKYSDEDNVASANMIVEFLKENCGIYAERRSIYRDIKEINRIYAMMEEDCTIDEADEKLESGEADELIVYDSHKKGYYAQRMKFDAGTIQLLIEAVYAAKFMPKSTVLELEKLLKEFVSDAKAKEIFHDVHLVDRVRTNNNKILYSISKINDAMQGRLYGAAHTPEKISFKYLTHTLGSDEQVERHHGKNYVVSPYKLLINEGNYYLLAYVDDERIIKTFRVDRMKDVEFAHEPRSGKEAFDKIDMSTYTQRIFSMYGGEQKYITLRCANRLLDPMVERFGKKGVQYSKCDEDTFYVAAPVQISQTFYGWLLSFGDKAQLVSPLDAVKDFKDFLDEIRAKYD